MRIAVFGTKSYDRRFLDASNARFRHELTFFEPRLDATTVALAKEYPGLCVFVNDCLDEAVLAQLAKSGTKIIALRCAGYNNLDLQAAKRLGIAVVRVPAYSPHAVAEFTIGLMLALDRNIPRAWSRVRDNNFALDGLIGRGLFGRTIGVVGTGRIGVLVAKALKLGFGCKVLASDTQQDASLVDAGVEYVEVKDLLEQSDIVTLHCPLTPDTRHLIDSSAIAGAKDGVTIVNTSRGGLIDTQALIDGLKSRKIGGVALDVYEQEGDLFFEDLSGKIVDDDVFQLLLTFPNVLVTGHQAFLTEESLKTIADTTLASLTAFEAGQKLEHAL